MNTQAGLLYLVLAIVLVVLWMRGYLSAWLDMVAQALQASPAKTPLGFPGQAQTQTVAGQFGPSQHPVNTFGPGA